jgi:LysM repeat protein
MRRLVLAVVGILLFANSAELGAQAALKGSRTTMLRQNSIAQSHDYTFLRTSSDVQRFAGMGLLVPVRNTASLKLASVSYPYARPAVKLFAERLASQYRASCGEKLVITSLTRPLSKQPRNASDLSVHPAGMALDIRMSKRRACRKWLEKTLVSLERRGVIDATRERRPVHYHVAVFPARYERYVAQLTGKPAIRLAARPAPESKAPQAKPIAKADQPNYASVVPLPATTKSSTHKVRRGETLWAIARKHGVTVTALQEANQLRSSRILPGQTLSIPRLGGSAGD